MPLGKPSPGGGQRRGKRWGLDAGERREKKVARGL